MGNRLTLPLILLAALLAGGAFFWMSGGERRATTAGRHGGAQRSEHEGRGQARLEAPTSVPDAAPSPSAARAPLAAEPEAPKSARKAKAAAETTTLSGRVVDRFQAPIAGARVVAAADTGFPLDLDLERELPWLHRQRTVTDAEGRFRFEAVEPGTLHLGVRASGFAPSELRGVAVPRSGLELEPMTLARGALLSGQVVDPDGRGVSGARIVRDELGEGAGVFMLGSREPAGVTDADGRFRVDELACGAWRFVVQSEEHPDLAVEGLADEPGVEQGGLRWQLAPGATIAGTVTGVPSGERGQLEVRATRGNSEGFLGLGRARVAKVEASGAFVARGLVPGESYSLQARRSEAGEQFGFFERSRSNSVQARAGDSAVVLSYQPEAALVFGVFDAKTRLPLERFEVEAGIEWPVPLSDEEGRTRTLFPGGQVRVGGLRPSSDQERVRLNVKATGYAELQRADIAVRAGQELDLGALFLEPVPLVRVRVTDKKTHAPIAEATVRIEKERGDTREFRRSIAITNDEGHESIDFGEGRSATTGADGWAELTSYEGATVTISARAKGYAPGQQEGVLLPRGERLEQELALSLGGEVLVHVLDVQGAAQAGASVEHRSGVEAPQGEVLVFGGARPGTQVTDVSGTVLFSNLAPGQHSFRLAESGGGGGGVFGAAGDYVFAGLDGGGGDDSWTNAQVVEGERTELTLRAAPRSDLAGRVREAGKVLAGATLRLEAEKREEGPSFRLPGMGGGPEGKSDGEGRYRIDDVKAGRYTLVVEHPTRRMPAEYAVELREGQNSFDVDLALAIISGRIVGQDGKGLAGVRVWPERQTEGGERTVRARMIMIDDGGGGGMVDTGQFGERAVSDADGRYTLRGVMSDVPLLVKAEGDAVQPGQSEPVRLAPNEVKEGVDLALEAAGSIRVEAKLADGSAARFQLVQAEYLDEADPPLQPKFAFLQQGSTELSGLRPGRWKVNVRSAQGGPGENNPGQDQEVQVTPGALATATFELN